MSPVGLWSDVSELQIQHFSRRHLGFFATGEQEVTSGLRRSETSVISLILYYLNQKKKLAPSFFKM